MKHLIVILGSLLLLGCSEAQLEENFSSSISSTDNQNENPHLITKDEAIAMSSKFRNGIMGTRTSQLSDFTPICDFVISERKTRGDGTVSDTVAYILNYQDNSGFTILSADNRVYPILAFSETGNFTLENEIARDMFISNIEYYIDTHKGESVEYDVNEESFAGCYTVPAFVNSSLSQRDPFDKYVIQEHPGCPVGCVAVATALVMIHSKYELMNYHGSHVYLKSIKDGLEKKDITSGQNIRKRIVNGGIPYCPPYTYNQAVDSVAKLLYWVGKDVNMKYDKSVSVASASAPFSLLRSLGFIMATGYESYNLEDMVVHINNGCIAYLYGANPTSSVGHVWVADGCMYCVDWMSGEGVKDAYIHCDWGWGGYCNGYFNGSVFEVASRTYNGKSYFAVKREFQ